MLSGTQGQVCWSSLGLVFRPWWLLTPQLSRTSKSKSNYFIMQAYKPYIFVPIGTSQIVGGLTPILIKRIMQLTGKISTMQANWTFLINVSTDRT